MLDDVRAGRLRNASVAVAIVACSLLASGVAHAAPPPGQPVDPSDTTQINALPCDEVAVCEIWYSRAYVKDVLAPVVAPGSTAYGGSLAALCATLGPGAPVCLIVGTVQIGQGWTEMCGTTVTVLPTREQGT